MNPVTMAWIQGVFYFLTGLWPLVHMPSFIRVTGPKFDIWLVRTVGVLILCTSLVTLYSAVQGVIPTETKFLCILNAAALGAVDVIYVSLKRIPKVYLLDAVVECLLIGLWLSTWLSPSV